MRNFQKQNEYIIEKLKDKEKTVSTLLIPKWLTKRFLQKRKDEYGDNTVVYLRNLLKKYRALVHDRIPPPRKIKTEYQDENLNLQRVSFRPDNSDWIELGELSIAFGKSRCWIFSYLLEIDLFGSSEILSECLKVSVPTPPRLELKSYWTLNRFSNDFTRGYHLRV